MMMKREKAVDIMRKLTFPQSPAFVNNVVKNPNDEKKGKVSKERKNNEEKVLPSVVDFCRQKNIPFLDEEDRYYKINQFKQSHKMYSMSLNKCFETNRPSEYEIGVKNLTENLPP